MENNGVLRTIRNPLHNCLNVWHPFEKFSTHIETSPFVEVPHILDIHCILRACQLPKAPLHTMTCDLLFGVIFEILKSNCRLTNEQPIQYLYTNFIEFRTATTELP
jgi:hypothetical protein